MSKIVFWLSRECPELVDLIIDGLPAVTRYAARAWWNAQDKVNIIAMEWAISCSFGRNIDLREGVGHLVLFREVGRYLPASVCTNTQAHGQTRGYIFQSKLTLRRMIVEENCKNTEEIYEEIRYISSRGWP